MLLTQLLLHSLACLHLTWLHDKVTQCSTPEDMLTCHNLLRHHLHCAEKDEEGSEMLKTVKLVTAKTGTTIPLSE